MAQLNIRGQVLHPPGPWGSARPAAGVSLAIIDEDVGNASDTIWTGSTNAQGQYAGTTREWRDTRSVSVATPTGLRTTQVADATDVMLLKATASQRIGSRTHSITVPYVPAPAGHPAPPIVLGWGPPGLARVSVDGVAAATLSEFSRLIQGVFGVGAGIARGAVRREIRVYGEEVAMLREALAALEPELRGIEAQTVPMLQRDLARLRQDLGQTQGALQASGARAVASGAAVGRAVTSGLPTGPDLWAPVRQRLGALTGLLAQQLQRQASLRDHVNGGRLSALCAAVLRTLADALPGALQIGLGGAGLMAAALASVVACAATVLNNIPALMAALGMLGLPGVAEAGLQAAEVLDQSWFSSALGLVLVVCAVVILVATSPADGWTWFVEHITGENGLPGLRFALSR